MSRAPRYVEKGSSKPEERRNDSDREEQNPPKAQKPQKPFYRFDEYLIRHDSNIEQLPKNPRHPPNEKVLKEKVNELTLQIQNLKSERAQQKKKFKQKTAAEREKLAEVEDKINLGYSCIRQLEFDIQHISKSIASSKDKIWQSEDIIKKVGYKPVREEKKSTDKMNKRQLGRQIQQLEDRMLRQDLDKKQTDQINRQINKLKLLQVEAPEAEQVNSGGDEERERERANIQKERENIQKNIIRKIQINCKIEAIRRQIAGFQNDKDIIEDQVNKLKEGEEYKAAQQSKNKILSLRKQRSAHEEAFEQAYQAYDDEQMKIKYIKWANSIKEKKQEELIQEKRRRIEEKLAAKGKKEDKDDKKSQNDDKKERPPPPHPFAKELQNCKFLSSYCSQLKPKTETQKEEPVVENIDLAAAIKQGQWVKEKGITIIESKKKDHEEVAVKKPKKQPVQKQKEGDSKNLTHTMEIVRLFDSLKVVPPATVEQLDEIINSLKEKSDYYLKLDYNDLKELRQKPETFTYKKKEEDNKPKKINLSMAEFPSL